MRLDSARVGFPLVAGSLVLCLSPGVRRRGLLLVEMLVVLRLARRLAPLRGRPFNVAVRPARVAGLLPALVMMVADLQAVLWRQPVVPLLPGVRLILVLGHRLAAILRRAVLVGAHRYPVVPLPLLVNRLVVLALVLHPVLLLVKPLRLRPRL